MKKNFVLITAIFVLWVFLGWLLISAVAEKNRESIATKLNAQNALLALSISNELNRIRVDIPEIQGLLIFKKVLIAPSPELFQTVNTTLKQQALVAKANSIFIADRSGEIIAKGVPFADTFNSESDLRTSTSVNISDKPYFQKAVLELNAEYYETNNDLNSKMYHFAFPIKSGTDVIGVIALSYDLKAIYQSLNDSENINFLVGLDGVIFASNVKEMDFKTISPFSANLQKSIRNTKRYGLSSLEPISDTTKSAFFEEKNQQLLINEKKSNYLIGSKPVSNSSWFLISALSFSALLTGIFMTVIFYLTLSGLVFTFWLYLQKRSEVQNKLADLNIDLENRVEVLTGGLKKTNMELTELVSHYQTTQERLEQTQYELLQSARLAALGELSATLNHELSQPALALRAYTENSLKLLERGDVETVHQNFVEMHSICESMSHIMSTIKNFARQSSEKMRNISTGQIIRQSLPIVKHLIEKSGAEMHHPKQHLNIKIRCIPEQIEQVLVNLISNACDAVYRKPDAEIWLDIKEENGSVSFIVRNNYSAVNEHDLIKLFEPYYTTKKDGLGIGLVLCKRIIEAQDGIISARLCAKDKIEFIITLKQHHD